MKRPAFQFYPGDWRKDVELRACSLAARGLWIDLMCVAHECEPYGHLMLNNKPMTMQQMAGQIGVPAAQVKKLLEELLESGVARQTPEGAIYSKRMVDDERIRNARAEGGKAGAEHGSKGASHGSKGGRPPKPKGGSETPLSAGQEPPPSSSSPPSGDSEANASAGKPAEALTKAELWTAGKSLLRTAGMPEAQCGSFVGKLCKDYDDAIVIDAVRETVVHQPADPASFLKSACQRLSGERRPKSSGKHAGFQAMNYHEGVNADGSLA